MRNFFQKRFLAGLLAVFCMVGTLSGCKIEFPDDVVMDSSSVYDSASLPEQSASSQTSISTSDVISTSSGSLGETPSAVDSQTLVSSSETLSSNNGKPEGGGMSDSSSNFTVSSQQPSATPKPVEPEDAEVNEDKKLTCSMSITCKTILDNMDLFNKDKMSVLPKDGVIYAERTVTFYEGESVFDILARETKKNRIHMEHESFPLYNSEYIEGINNIYEKDCGEGSGWMYKVNGWIPNYGCSRYQVKSGDKIEWIYTCDLGHDLGWGMNG